MNLFRSEEHIAGWLNGRQEGATLRVRRLAELAQAWWGDRLHSTWQPRPRDASQAILTGLGLTGDFWQLP